MTNRTFVIIAGLSLALLSGCQDEATGSSPAVDYIPDTGWDDDEWASKFYEDWYGSQLHAMREPTLSSPSNLGGYTERFRLLVLPTFEPARSYRIDWLENGKAKVRWVQLDGAGGYDPGKIKCQGTRTLGSDETRALRMAFEAVDLFSLPTADELQKKSSTFCFDGTALVFERLNKSGRQFLTRHCHLETAVDRFSGKIQDLGARSPIKRLTCLLP
jgi:hypothetical protein